MPVYEYKGKHYELSDGLSKEEALNKIKGHLGEIEVQPVAPKSASVPQPADVPEYGLERAKAMLQKEWGGRTGDIVRSALLDPLFGIGQLATGGQSDAVNRALKNYREETRQARLKATGSEEGNLPAQILGSVISPVNYLIPGGAATTPLAKILSSARAGAVSGALTPTSGDEDKFVSDKLTQMGVGSLLGAGTSVVAQAAAKMTGILKDLPITAEAKLRGVYNHLKSLGADDAQIQQALKNAPEIVPGSKPTTAEALADLPAGAKLAAEQKRIFGTSEGGQTALERIRENAAARVRALKSFAGTEAQRTALLAERDLVTGGLRERALQSADIAGKQLATIDEQINKQTSDLIKQAQELSSTGADYFAAGQTVKRMMGPMAATVKKQQLTSLENNGVFALEVKPIVASIDDAIAKAEDDTAKTVLRYIKDKVVSKADDNGIISSRDLYQNVRKPSNTDINKLLGINEQYASGGIPAQAAKALKETKDAIDAALNKSSNGVWGKYLAKFKEYSAKHDQMEVGNYLVDKLQTPLDKEAAGAFATAVENAAGTIKKSTGMPRAEQLTEILTPNQMSVVSRVQADLLRKTKAEELANVISKQTPDAPEARISTLQRGVTLMNSALSYLKKGNVKEFNTTMTQLLANPQQLAQFMTQMETKQAAKQSQVMSELVQLMMKNMTDSNRNIFVKLYTVESAE